MGGKVFCRRNFVYPTPCSLRPSPPPPRQIPIHRREVIVTRTVKKREKIKKKKKEVERRRGQENDRQNRHWDEFVEWFEAIVGKQGSRSAAVVEEGGEVERLRGQVAREQGLVVQLEQDLQHREAELEQLEGELEQLEGELEAARGARGEAAREAREARERQDSGSVDRELSAFMAPPEVAAENQRLRAELDQAVRERRRLQARVASWTLELGREQGLGEEGLRTELRQAIKTLQIKDHKMEEVNFT